MGRQIDAATPLGVARARIAAELDAAGVEASAREASLLLQSATGLSAADMISSFHEPLGDSAARVEAFATRRAAREPLSRIEGRRGFWRYELAITPDVLDPRADTETVVEEALQAFAERRLEPLRVLDFGVGSGAILCALLGEWPHATGLGVDLSDAAAAVARLNIETLGLGPRAAITVGRWGEEIAGVFDVIVSNPPYVRTGDISRLDAEVRGHDPWLALDGGKDGLDAYRALAPEISRLLAPRGRFFLEIGAGQGDDVAKILVAAGLEVSKMRRDLSGTERTVSGAANNS